MNKDEKKGFWKSIIHSFVTDDVFWENEVAANQLTAKIMLLTAIVLLLNWILNETRIYDIRLDLFRSVAVWGSIELVVPAVLCLYFKGKKRWLKYLLIIELTIVLARIDSILTLNVTLIMLIPVILTCRYYSGSFTRQISLLTTVLFAVSAYCSAWFEMGQYNLMLQAEDKSQYLHNIMMRSFLPKWLIFILLAIVCIEIAQWGRSMVLNQDGITREHTRVETELEMASRIQDRTLPAVHALEDQDYYELSAMMKPAKEIGGDFYDFFYLDKTHLALIIADVSGKGVPAALLMMISKLLMDNSINSGKNPAKVMEEVNAQLCAKNLDNMFVTAWLGVLNLETGDLITANAGHEYPLICRKDGNFEVIKDKHGFVLGGMENMRYRETQLHLDPGDIIFVYTDGVPEANDADGNQFDLERTISSLNQGKEKSMDEMTKHLKQDIDAFAGETPQFDDTTMLALRMLRYMESEGIVTAADEASISQVSDYVQKSMENTGLEMKAMNKINICVDEVYSNIVYYSTATQARVSCKTDTDSFMIVFRDNGIPFDPTKQPDPTLSGDAAERDIGGLGIYMVKKLMNKVEYRYDCGENELKMTFCIHS